MSEGKYGRLPQPKDRTRRKVDVSLGSLELKPEHDKAGEWAEEGDVLRPHAEHKPEESTVAKLGRLASELGAAGGGAWSRFMKDDEEKP